MQHHQFLNTEIRDFLQGALHGSDAHFARYVAESVSCWGFPEFNPVCRNEYQGFFNLLADVFANASFTVDQLLTSGSEALVSFSIIGIHHEEFLGLKATGCLLSMRGRLLMRLKEGRISQSWMYDKSVRLTTPTGLQFELQPETDVPALLSVARGEVFNSSIR